MMDLKVLVSPDGFGLRKPGPQLPRERWVRVQKSFWYFVYWKQKRTPKTKKKTDIYSTVTKGRGSKQLFGFQLYELPRRYVQGMPFIHLIDWFQPKVTKDCPFPSTHKCVIDVDRCICLSDRSVPLRSTIVCVCRVTVSPSVIFCVNPIDCHDISVKEIIIIIIIIHHRFFYKKYSISMHTFFSLHTQKST
jgi:hypothetical protein